MVSVRFRSNILTFFIFFAIGIVLVLPRFTYAATKAEIQSAINNNKSQRAKLETDIVTLQKQRDLLSTKRNTLKSTITSLKLSQKQFAIKIKLTKNSIASTNFKIQNLSFSINDKESIITSNKNAIGKMLRDVAQADEMPFIANMIASDSLSDAWRMADQAVQLNRALSTNIANLQVTKTALADNRENVVVQKKQLVSLAYKLSTQKHSVDVSKSTQETLLIQTKNRESNYQKLIAKKKAAQKSFENELVALQSQLNLIVHPGSLPKVGTGLLSWPLSAAFMNRCSTRKRAFGNSFCITQFFGNTSFSTKNPQIYNGHGHNAIDIAVPIGTPIHAALSGKILDTGNTDLVKNCYSFGKWVMIDHGDGINTMYAHLSEINVSPGQKVSTGQIIGLSGMTGYATGPHIHFGVYATEGTKIMTLRQFRGATIGCADAKMPVATLNAYLNPLSYL